MIKPGETILCEKFKGKFYVSVDRMLELIEAGSEDIYKRLGRIEKKIDLVSHFTYTLKEDQKKILQNQELLLHQPTAMEKEMLRLLKWVVMFNEEFKRPNISDIMDEGTEEEK